MRFYYRMPDVIMKQMIAALASVPTAVREGDDKQSEEKETMSKSSEKQEENKKKIDKITNGENVAKVKVSPEDTAPVNINNNDVEKKEDKKQKTDEVPQENTISTSRPLSKQDELPVSVLLSLGQCRVENKDDHKFLEPLPVTPKNGITGKSNAKLSPKSSVNKIASELAEHKSQLLRKNNTQLTQNNNSSAPAIQPSNSPIQQIQKNHQILQNQQTQQNQQIQHIQQIHQIQHIQQNHQIQQSYQIQQMQQLQTKKKKQRKQPTKPKLNQQQPKNNNLLHQQFILDKQKMQLIMQQQQQQNAQQQHLFQLQHQQQQQLLHQHQLQQIQQAQRQQQIHQLQQQPPIVQHVIQQLPIPVQQLNETKTLDQTIAQPTQEQPTTTSNNVQQATNVAPQAINVSQAQPISQTPLQQPLQTKEQTTPQQQKSRPEVGNSENRPVNGEAKVTTPQVTLNTSKGSVTIMAQFKNPGMVPALLSVQTGTAVPTVPTNGKPSDTPKGIHQNLPRTILPKTSFVNGKSVQKIVQQKNISGQRLNNSLPEGRNHVIQQSNMNSHLPTFQKNGGTQRKPGVPSAAVSKAPPSLDERIQQLYNSGQTNKPVSPRGKSRLAHWLDNRFNSPTKEETESNPPSPQTLKEANKQHMKRKLSEINKGQEICEITQENPKPDDPKKRREVTPDVSIELMRAADMKKLEPAKKEKRPMPALKSIQEMGVKKKKEDDSALDLRKAGDLLQSQRPWLMTRPPHFIPRPT